MTTPFPSPQERTVASALLLLSASASASTSTSAARLSFPPTIPGSGGGKKLSLSSGKSGSRSCTSSMTSDGSSSKAPVRSFNQLKKATVAPRSLIALKLKVAKKKRTKVVRWTSSDRSGSVKGTDSFSGSVSTEHGSCVSSSSFTSPAAAARGGCLMKTAGANNQTTALISQRKRAQSAGSASLGRRAEAIMKLLSGGFLSEVSIREALGDSPDTSKALRMLLKREAIKRSGTGGRCDPYVYTVA